MNSENILSLPLDVVDEVLGNNLEKLAEMIALSPLSEEAKQVDLPSKQEMSKLGEDQVALILYHPHRGEVNKFAHYNKELAEINLYLLSKKANYLPDEIVKVASHFLSKSGRRWGVEIPKELKEFAKEACSSNRVDISKINKRDYELKVEKRAQEVTSDLMSKLGSEDFALPSKRKYPLVTETQIKAASAYFDTYHQELPLTEKLTFAGQTREAAKRENTDVSENIQKFASLEVNNFNNDLCLHLRSRTSFVKDTEKGALYKDLEDKYENLGPIKTAAALEEIDKIAGIDRLWGRKIEEPAVAVFNQYEEPFVKVSDTEVTQEMLNSALQGDVSGIIDDYTTSELKKDYGMEVFESLPDPIKDELIDRM